jgi:hypothetical protein
MQYQFLRPCEEKNEVIKNVVIVGTGVVGASGTAYYLSRGYPCRHLFNRWVEFSERVGSADTHEALTAFSERPPPRFDNVESA